MAGVQISNIATKQDLMCGANFLNVAYVSSNDYTVSGMIECAGAWYRFVDEPVTVTTSDYIKIIPSTGSATLAAITSFSGVAFDTDKNGYYVTGTNERVFAYRDLTTTVLLISNTPTYGEFYATILKSENGLMSPRISGTTGSQFHAHGIQWGYYSAGVGEQTKVSGTVVTGGVTYIAVSVYYFGATLTISGINTSTFAISGFPVPNDTTSIVYSLVV